MGFNSRFFPACFCLAVAGGMALMPVDSGANGFVPDLPHAEGQRFETLDAYLAHLQELGTIGIAWYERLPDGRYQLIKRRVPGTEPEIFTRRELLEKFGFHN